MIMPNIIFYWFTICCIERELINYTVLVWKYNVSILFLLKVNMQASGLKNELNAAQHFLKFLQATLALPITNSRLSALLANVASLLQWHQEGALKNIGKAREQKPDNISGMDLYTQWKTARRSMKIKSLKQR